MGYLKGFVESHLAGGAWIETYILMYPVGSSMSHLAGGAWIETITSQLINTGYARRTSQEVRGLNNDMYF